MPPGPYHSTSTPNMAGFGDDPSNEQTERVKGPTKEVSPLTYSQDLFAKGLFPIVKRISKLAYQLKLPGYIKIHPVISVIHLEPAIPDPYERPTTTAPEVIEQRSATREDATVSYQAAKSIVDRILQKELRKDPTDKNKYRFYKVKFVDDTIRKCQGSHQKGTAISLGNDIIPSRWLISIITTRDRSRRPSLLMQGSPTPPKQPEGLGQRLRSPTISGRHRVCGTYLFSH
ncbi:hypothetical protein K504DRAFT_501650 [Pleomassaria siparia CBS 279.74]|uniref:Uncharacterized protein n=1 Tax=Pleomassaria siparia CBS 279.74 TaxID=1314801 RepID=A0A6G1KC77_9PLEO|nr:hypothetical protein K504DRAFT_501650 [Pleomassaria siparia CBS 279.74]